MSLLAAAITKVCFAWILCYITFGGTSVGKDFFSSLVWWGDTKGGLPLLTLTYPTLVAASVCSLLVVQRSRRSCLCPPQSHRWQLRRFLRPLVQRLVSNHGDGNFDLSAALFLLLPLASYSITGIRRHLNELDVTGPFPLLALLLGWRGDAVDSSTKSEAVMEIANSLAMMAVVAMGLFLIPTSKNGPIIKVFGWSHALAIRLHIWAGRILSIGALLHGLLHTIRWKYQLGEHVTAFIFPPRQCWTSNDEAFTPTCRNEDTECTCHEHFIYFTGFISAILATIILLTSSHWVRRQSYRFFLLSHFLAAPLFMLMIMFHYHRAVLYMSPSLIYYLATTLPPYLERRRNVGITITSVDMIGTERQSQYFSLTFEATRETVQSFRPGMYTLLSVPSISSFAHPFTLNRVVGEEDSFRIIFKVNGPFTQQLAALLRAESGIPTIQMNGLHGCPKRMHQLRHHDTNILVAGGIGITPFLSLLRDAVETNSEDGKILPHYASRLQVLSLHWSCRDSSQIHYIRREYPDTLENKITPYCQTHLHLYHTHSALRFLDVENDHGMTQERQVSIRRLEHPSQSVQVTEPFRLSRFAPSRHIRQNLVQALAMIILVWPGLAVVWHSYSNYQSDRDFQGRAVAPIALVFYIGLISYLFSRFLPYQWFGKGNTQDIEFNLVDDSEHSEGERLHLTTSTSVANVSNTDIKDECPHRVTVECHEGRPNLVSVLEPLERAQWPAVFTCGPTTMAQHVQAIVEETSKSRHEAASSLVTIYDEAFLM